ncbi:CBS domain-containing protein [Clostridiisalibacter paucivorans]|uniref:CBS domain-containing protein n=1 Tax=Clostridiisalibacter paucivorans TaxID=408753 RepID=UPI00047AFB0D|nr:CBS domain-containing protein [Clostridiisalibacter paucivorans]
MNAKDIMTKEVVTVNPNDTAEKVTKILLQQEISGVPVVDEKNKVVGIVTEADLMFKDKDIKMPAYISLLGGFIMLESIKKFEGQLRKMASDKVKDIMTTPVIKVKESDDIRSIVNIMLDKNINRVPVINDEYELVGIIARSDILKYI